MESSRDDYVIAIRSAFLNKGTKQRFSILALILFSIIFLILGSFNFKAVDYAKTIIKEIVYRSSFIISTPENIIKKNYFIIQRHLNLYENNKKDRSELDLLKSKDLSRQILTLENIKYKKLIDDYFIRDNETYAKVLIDKQSPFLRSVILNKGSKNNIKLGMVVLDEGYLVGKVVEVNYFTSRVLLITDINSKIPVSLQPGDIQAIMSGKGKKTGVIQYIKDSNLSESTTDSLVLTSGAGGVFKSGIPVGIIMSENTTLKNHKIVNLYKDFSQLQYVKVVSFLNESDSIDKSYKNVSKILEDQITETNQRQEAIRVLKEQKKIADEIRIKIEEENRNFKIKIIKLQEEILITKRLINENKIKQDEINFNKLNTKYKRLCKKTFYNKLFKEGTKEYRECILNKGLKKSNG